MKYAAALLSAALAIGATPAAAENWNVYSTTDTSVYMVDLDTIRGTTAWTAQVSLIPEPVDEPVLITEFEVRCSDLRARLKAAFTYDEAGKNTDMLTDPSDWIAAPPGSVLASFMRQICDNSFDPESNLGEVGPHDARNSFYNEE